MSQTDRLTDLVVWPQLRRSGHLPPVKYSRADAVAWTGRLLAGRMTNASVGKSIRNGPMETPVCHMAIVSGPAGNSLIIHKRKPGHS